MFAALALLFFPTLVRPADTSQHSEPSEEDLRILEVVLEETILSEAIAGYAGASGETMLPLQAMSELLAVAITTKPSEGLASGFILDERRTFHLDAGRKQVTISGKQRSFDSELVRVYHDDIYVDSALLSEWLPVAFDIDLFALRIRVRPREPLPLQLRLERERRIRHWRLYLPPGDPGYPRQRTSYRLWEAPFVDQTLRVSINKAASASFATYATGDLLFMESEAYLAGGDRDLFDAARLTLRRRDPGAAIGGWLGATEVALGHVLHPSSGLLSTTSEPLPGFLVTNFPLNRPVEFDRHTFRGNLPPGWDVELYHNGALIDYAQSRADGRFVFENIPVLFGMNFFRLVFYGPQGQRRVEETRFLLGDSLTAPGHFDYRVTGNIESRSRRRASVLGSYGISRHLTATAEAALLPVDAGARRYGKVGLRAFWSTLFAYGDFVQDDHDGRAWEAGVQTRILGANLLVNRQAVSRGFVSEVFALPGDSLVFRDRIRVDSAIPAWILPRIPVNLELERQRLASGLTRTVAQNRLSLQYKGLSITNRVLWTAVSEQTPTFEAGLQASRYIRGLGIRGELLYTLAPLSFATANITLEKSLASGYRVHANVSRSFLGQSHVYSIGIDKTTGSFSAGLNAMRDAGGNAAANVDLSAGFGRDPREGRWLPDARGRAAFGAISARVYLDRDENGRFNAGDHPLPQVGFTINGIDRVERTSESGIAFLPEVPPHLPADVAVNVVTLEDPQWVPQVRGLRVTPRPGKAVTIEVPVIATAEIEGTVYQTGLGGRREVAGAAVELLDLAGRVIQTTTTAYDGFYVLSQVRSGRYRVRVAQESAASPASPNQGLEKPVTVTPAQPVIPGVDFVMPEIVSRSPAVKAVADPRPPDPAPAASPVAPVSPASENHGYAVQLGSFSITANAERQAGLVRDMVEDVTILREGRYSVVRSGRRTRSDAVTLARALANRGIQAIVIRTGDSGRLRDRPAPAYIVQLGAFRIAKNAFDLARQIAERGARWQTTVDRRGPLHFVVTGPFATREAADAARDALVRLGFPAIVRQPDSP